MNKEELKDLFSKHNLASIWHKIEHLIKNSIRIKIERTDDQIMLGKSKLGGRPDLPKDINWFEFEGKSLSFIAQINCLEVSDFDIEKKLPNTGIIYFFYDSNQETWGFDPKDKGNFKVYYYDGNIENLEHKEIPPDLDSYSIFKSCSISFKNELSIPDFDSNILSEALNNEKKDYYDYYYELDEDIFKDDYTINKLLGYSNNIQGDMELQCELVTNGLYCGDSSGYENPKAETLRENIKDWQLLLQIDSNDEAEMMWGDAGRLYFWIKKIDLENKNFENTWFSLQCF